MSTFIQLNIFGDAKPTRIYRRDYIGRFASKEPTNEEKLQRENYRLKNENEMLERKVISLVNYQRILLTENK
jgi:hypothetical protein